MVRLPMRRISFDEYQLVIKITREEDIVLARQMVKNLASEAGFSLVDVTKIATVVSELSRNIFHYAGSGLILARLRDEGEKILEIVAYDEGPGIENLSAVLRGGYSTTPRSFGLGLSGVKKLMDDFEIESEKGKGTIVRVEKRQRRF